MPSQRTAAELLDAVKGLTKAQSDMRTRNPRFYALARAVLPLLEAVVATDDWFNHECEDIAAGMDYCDHLEDFDLATRKALDTALAAVDAALGAPQHTLPSHECHDGCDICAVLEDMANEEQPHA